MVDPHVFGGYLKILGQQFRNIVEIHAKHRGMDLDDTAEFPAAVGRVILQDEAGIEFRGHPATLMFGSAARCEVAHNSGVSSGLSVFFTYSTVSGSVVNHKLLF